MHIIILRGLCNIAKQALKYETQCTDICEQIAKSFNALNDFSCMSKQLKHLGKLADGMRTGIVMCQVLLVSNLKVALFFAVRTCRQSKQSEED